MNDRERFLNVLNYKPVDRGIYGVRVGWWPETEKRWRQEGYNPDDKPLFETDRWQWYGDWFWPYPSFAEKVIEDEGDTLLMINDEGSIVRVRKDEPRSSMPEWVKYPVETRDDFRKFYQERMNDDLAPRLRERIGENWKEKLKSYRNRDFPLLIHAGRYGGFFGPLRTLVGVERACMLFYDDPEFVEEMMDCIAEYIIGLMDKVLDYTDIDVFAFWEDMAYKNGPLINPELVRKFMLPRYKKVIKHLKSRGVKWFGLDSDGNIESLIPIWLEADITFIYPLEVQSGMDVLALRDQFGRKLRMVGGINKRALASGPEAIDAELERVAPLIEEGGYIAAPDHSLPPDVSFDNYCYYMEKLKEYITIE